MFSWYNRLRSYILEGSTSMELENIENALEELAEEQDVSVEDIKALICQPSAKATPLLSGLTKLRAGEAFQIKRLLMKAALREYEEKQKADKKKARESGDSQGTWQSKVAYRAWDITALLRKYAELRGKDPKVHSLDKWAGQESY